MSDGTSISKSLADSTLAIMPSLLWYCVLVSSSFALWPQPKQVEHGSSTLWLSPNVQLAHASQTASSQPLAWLWTTVQQLIP